MSWSERGPMNIRKDPDPKPERRTVTFRLVNMPPLSVRLRDDEADRLLREVTSTWSGSDRFVQQINDPDGPTYLLNPAQIVAVEVR